MSDHYCAQHIRQTLAGATPDTKAQGATLIDAVQGLSINCVLCGYLIIEMQLLSKALFVQHLLRPCPMSMSGLGAYHADTVE